SGANQHYKGWSLDGRLILTDGDRTDFNQIAEDLVELNSVFGIQQLAFDPAQSPMLIDRLQAEGITCVEIRPTVMNFSTPMKELEALIRAGAIEHDGCPVM